MAIWSEAFGHPIEWVGPTSHRYKGGLKAGTRGLVEHIASGFYQGTISWQKNATADSPTSSHWIVGRNGRIAQMVDTDDASWAQSSGNQTWHSVENEGFGTDDGLHAKYPWERLTDAQVEANAALYAKGHLELGWPLQLANSVSGRGLGHHSMGAPAWGHASCPGDPIISQKQAILDRAIALVVGPPPSQEDEMSNSHGVLSDGFAADENGNITDKALMTVLPLDPGPGRTSDTSVACDLGSIKLRVATKPDGGNWSVRLLDIDSTDGRVRIVGPGEIPGGGLITLARCKHSATDTDDTTPAGWVVNVHAA